MKIHILAAAVAIVLAWGLGLTSVEKALIIMAIAGVITAELINTAVEAVVDLVSPEYHPLAKLAKDAAAGAVLVAAVAAVVIGCLLMGPRLLY